MDTNTPDASAEINALLGIGSSDTDSTETQTASALQTQGDVDGQAKSDVFKFGGRAYKTQQDAEKAHNNLYGKFSDQQNTLNKFKAALRNPEMLKTLSGDPEMVQVLAKLGIQEAQESRREREAQLQQENAEFTPEKLHEAILMDRAAIQLEREEMRFERKMGRNVTDEEHNTVYEVIQRAPSLTYAEAWKLAFHDKMLQDAAQKQAAKVKQDRPAPTPMSRMIPGVKLDLKKDISQMSRAEAREALRMDPDFQNLVGRSR